MKKLFLNFILAMIVASPVTVHAASASDDDIKTVMRRTVDDVFIPGYEKFHNSAVGMSAAMKALCTENSAPAYQAARASFGELVSAWSKIEVLRDGPVLSENRMERILFFPDKKGLALKQIQALLAKKDPADITPEAMAQKSVAVQGLQALEYVLVGTGFEELSGKTDNFRCRAGEAIADNIEKLAGELDDAWKTPDGIARDWRDFGPQNAVYRNGEEALAGLLGTLVRGIENVNEKRLMIFYAEEGKLANAKKALYWRSDETMLSIADNLEGLKQIWDLSGMQGIINGDASAITTNINFEFKTAIETARKLNQPVQTILDDEKLRSRLEFLLLTVADLQVRLNNDYGRAMGLGSAFTFTDGD